MNRSQRRRVETHDRLFAALRREISESGLHEITVQAVTERADVALGTFYNHFDHKNTAVDALAALEFSALMSACATVDGHSEQIPRLITTSVSLLAKRGAADRQWITYMAELATCGCWPGIAGRRQFVAECTDAHRRGAITIADGSWAASVTDGLIARIVLRVRDADLSSSPEPLITDSIRTILRTLGVAPDVMANELAYSRSIPELSKWPEHTDSSTPDMLSL